VIEVIRPTDREAWLRLRGHDLTASTIGALFGEHEYLTAFALWQMKAGRMTIDAEETPAMQRGRLLERVAVDLLREQHPDWTIHHNAADNTYFRDPEHRLGATPDVIVTAPGRGKGVVQVKSVEPSIFRRKWLDEEGNAEPPVWIALQATLEAYLTGANWASVAPLVIGHGLEMPLTEVPLVPGVMDAIKAKAADFWRSIAEGREPTADYRRDAETIDRLYGAADPEAEVDLSGDNLVPELLAERAAAVADRNAITARVTEIDAEIKLKLGRAVVGHIGDGRRITWKPQRKGGFFVSPTTIRVLHYPPERNNP